MADDLMPTIEKLTTLVERMAADRAVLLNALRETQRVAAWMAKRNTDGRSSREIHELLDIAETALRKLSVPSCFAPKDRVDG